jgi:hypothetical protein
MNKLVSRQVTLDEPTQTWKDFSCQSTHTIYFFKDYERFYKIITGHEKMCSFFGDNLCFMIIILLDSFPILFQPSIPSALCWALGVEWSVPLIFGRELCTQFSTSLAFPLPIPIPWQSYWLYFILRHSWLHVSSGYLLSSTLCILCIRLWQNIMLSSSNFLNVLLAILLGSVHVILYSHGLFFWSFQLQFFLYFLYTLLVSWTTGMYYTILLFQEFILWYLNFYSYLWLKLNTINW